MASERFAKAPLGTGEALQLLVAFKDLYGTSSLLLAAHAAVLERMRSDVVALIRCNFLSGSDRRRAYLDADVLFGPLSVDQGGGYFQMHREVRRLLLRELDEYGGRRGKDRYLTSQVANFVRHYVERSRSRHPLAKSPSFRSYLDEIGWVALALDAPEQAAEALFSRVQQGLEDDSGEPSNKVLLGGVASLLRLPMTALQSELLLADFHDLIVERNDQAAERVVSPILHRRTVIGPVELPAPAEVLEGRRARGDFQSSGESAPATSHEPVPNTLSRETETIEEPEPYPDTELHRAVRDGDPGKIEHLLLSEGHHVDAVGVHGATALHLASSLGYEAIVEQLLDAGANVEAQNRFLASPLYAAAERGHTAVGRLLLDAGADVQSTNRRGSTPLLAAAHDRHLEMVGLLLSHQSPFNLPNRNAYSPIGAAAHAGHLAIFRKLREAGATAVPSEDGRWNELLLAAMGGHPRIIEVLIEWGFSIDCRTPDNWTPLMVAAHKGHAEAVKLLAELGAHLEARKSDDWHATALASYWNHADVLHVLAEYGADLNASVSNHLSPLHIAARRANAEAVTALLAHSTVARNALTDQGESALILAILSDSEETLRALLDDPSVDRNQRHGLNEKPPLWIAAEKKSKAAFEALCRGEGTVLDSSFKEQFLLHKLIADGSQELVGILLQSGGNPNIATKDGKTPIAEAIAKNSAEIVQLLIDHGADLSPRLDDGSTFLHIAAARPSPEIVSMLLDHGVPAEGRDERGRTALHIAASVGSAEVVEELLKRPYSSLLVDNEGITPLFEAIKSGNTAAALSLIEAGVTLESGIEGEWSALHLAAQRNDVEVVSALVSRAGTLNALSVTPALTPLQAAAEAGAAEVCRFLLKAGAAPGRSTRRRAAAIVLAVQNGHFDTALALAQGGASLRVTDPATGSSLVEVFKGRLRLEGKKKPSSEEEIAFAELLSGRPRSLEQSKPRSKSPDEAPPSVRKVSRPTSASVQAPQKRPRRTSGREQPRRPGDATPLMSSGTFLREMEFTRQDGPVELPWTLLSEEERVRFLESIDPTLDLGTSPQIVSLELPFYDDIDLIRVREAGWDRLRALFFLYGRGFLLRLNGTSPPIHEVNAKAPIVITPSNVLDYLRFFCFFVHGAEGPFYLLESIEDEGLPTEISPVARGVIEGTVRPATLEGVNPSGHYLVDAVLCYSNAIFIANFAVQTNGMVEMLDDEPIAADLPLRIDPQLV